MPTITPTVGRKVYYYENAAQRQPFDATIIRVAQAPEDATPETLCNLNVTDPDSARMFLVTDVQASDEPVDVPHFRWMAYQVGQAATAPAAADANVSDKLNVLRDAVLAHDERIDQLAQAVSDQDSRITTVESIVAPPPAPAPFAPPAPSTSAPTPDTAPDPAAAPAAEGTDTSAGTAA